MSDIEVEWEDLVEKFSQSVGREKAEELIEDAVTDSGAGKKNAYSKDEVLDIADAIKELDDSTTYVKIAANTLKAQIRTSGTVSGK